MMGLEGCKFYLFFTILQSFLSKFKILESQLLLGFKKIETTTGEREYHMRDSSEIFYN